MLKFTLGPEGATGGGAAVAPGTQSVQETTDTPITTEGAEGGAAAVNAGSAQGDAGSEGGAAETETGTGEGGSGSNAEPTEAELAQRRANAERRRAYEQRRAAEIAQREQAARDKVYADMFKGQISEFIGKAIESEADYKAHLDAKNKAAMEQRLRAGRVSMEDLEKLVNERIEVHPDVVAARESKAAMERARAQAAAQAAKARIETELKTITAIMPEIKTMQDIAAMPTAGRVNELVATGKVNLVEAFRLANAEEIAKRQSAAARQGALNSVYSKEHMSPLPSAAAAAADVPENLRSFYKKLNPQITEAQMLKQYQAYQKSIR